VCSACLNNLALYPAIFYGKFCVEFRYLKEFEECKDIGRGFFYPRRKG
jgi:hypothetical protein